MKHNQLNKTGAARTGKGILDLINAGQKPRSSDGNSISVEASALRAIWESLLGHSNFSEADDFFHVGGNSLKAVQLVSRISNHFSANVQLTDIFLHTTILDQLKLIQESRGNGFISLSISPYVRPVDIPVSYSQEQLWFIDQMEGSLPYHIPAVLRMTGKLDLEALNRSLTQIVNRHEVLRSVFYQGEEGKVYQRIKEKGGWELDMAPADFSKGDAVALNQYIRQLVEKPFDLSKDDIVRATLLSLGEEEHLLVITMHHIASDGWSVGLMIKEAASLYRSYSEGLAVELIPLEFQYADYSIWQRNYLQGEVLENKISYWKKQLEGVAALELPLDYPRPSVQSICGAESKFSVSKELVGELEKLCHAEGVTLFMVLLAAYKILLHRYSWQEDICVGTPVANRGQQEVEGLIGFFVNTLALRSEVKGQTTFRDFLQELKDTTMEAYGQQDVPFEKVVEAVSKERDLSRSPLFQAMLVLQNTPEVPELALGAMQLTIEPVPSGSSKFEITFSFTETAGRLEGTIEYNTDLFKEETLERMAGHFVQLLESIVKSPSAKLSGLKMLSSSEEEQILKVFNNTAAEYPANKSIVDLFEEQVQKTPANTALIFEESHINYKELNEKSNQFARYLQSKGVKEETPVPICIERSIEMIVGILGILKAGGAYVPIDPEYPEDRIKYMLEDTGASVIASSKVSINKLPALTGAEIIQIDTDWEEISKERREDLQIKIEPSGLAYIIYTSGSTGKPKGVMIEHRNVYSFISWCQQEFSSDIFEIVYASTSMCFDLSVFEFFYPLSIGKPIRLLENGLEIGKYLPGDRGVMTNSVPVVIESLIREGVDLENISVMNMAGEPISAYVQQELDAEKIVIRNLYGPTEDTTYSTVYQLKNGKEALIGKPISNTSVLILSQEGDLVPVGVAGEICLSGEGLSRGYLNREELTAEKFVPNTFSEKEGARLYKTGDLGRWLPDGNIQYLGRIDNQVKIRGFRIELGEIEAVLLQSGLVKQTVVIARESREGVKRLVGYVVSEEKFDKEQLMSKIRLKLPEYMVPSLWVEMEILPLTLNGKIDKKSLPDPDFNELADKEYVAPRNEFEKKLAEIWQRLLGIERISMHDNFFELGGDSILTIQIVSRARRAGLELRPKDIFINQTIRKLSSAFNDRLNTALSGEQGKLTGFSGLLPIQQSYFQKEPRDISYFNQSVILKIDKRVSLEVLEPVVENLCLHHDALRFTYSKNNDGWQQEYGELSETVFIENINSDGNDIPLDSFIKKISDTYQKSLDIEKGRLIRVVLMQTSSLEKYNRLFIVIHHLAVDGISWRIILDDLNLLIGGIIEGKPTLPGNKSNSYREWFEGLKEYSQTERLLSQQKYWQEISKKYIPLKTDKSYDGLIREKDIINFDQHLGKEQTLQLIHEVSGVYHTEINDILLAALAKTLCDFSGTNQVTVGLEGHGREEIEEGKDITHTVGWFTTLYPVLLEKKDMEDSGEELSNLIKSAKENLRQTPEKGIGYGVLKYINKEKSLQGEDPWDILFNYLGQVDNIISDSKWFNGTDLVEAMRSEELEVNEKLSINCIIRNGELVTNWAFTNKHYKEETVNKLAACYIANLGSLIAQCIEQQKEGEIFTPSDYDLGAAVTYSQLDKFLDETLPSGRARKNEIDGLYPLSSLQQGMLFHSLYDNKAESYTNLFSCDLIGLNLDIFHKSWKLILKNHSILRTGFYYDKFDIPVQCVYNEVKLPVQVLDYRDIPVSEQYQALKSYEQSELRKGFDFSMAPLMRFSLIRLSEDRYKMLWLYHHIISDGWSMSVLMEEFLNTYEAYAKGRNIKQIEVDKFEDYIRQIKRRNKNQEQVFWKEYLSGFESGTMIPFTETNSERNHGVGSYASSFLNLDAGKTAQIRDYIQKHRLTANTLMQGVWAYILNSYTGSQGVLFGVVVSGRPDDLDRVEQRVGMYINTLPLLVNINKNKGIVEWLTEMQTNQLSLRQYQYAPLSDIKEWSGIKEELFDTLFVFENYPISKLAANKEGILKAENVSIHEHTNYPLTIIIVDGDIMNIEFSYNPELITEVNVGKIRNHFEHVLWEILNNSEGKLSDISILDVKEKQQLISEFNNTAAEYPANKSIVDLFEEQVQKTPANTALIFEENHINYKELNEKSNQFARYLQSKGVKEETPVPICIERSIEMIVGILGILKAGGAYVPIDPEYPEDRIKYMLEDTGASVIASSKASRHKLPALTGADIIQIDTDWEEISKERREDLQIKIEPSNLAYIIYTSGSTGKPKGVMIEHRNVYSFISWCQEEFSSDIFEIVYASTSMCFDLSVFEFFYPLSIGKPIRLLENGLEIGKYLPGDRGVMTNSVPVVIESLIREGVDLDNITVMNMAGEPISAYVQQELDAEKIVIRNLYGPTEDTTYSTVYQLKNGKEALIGKPISNTSVLVLSQEGDLVPVGVAGEICLSGEGLSRGYLNREELTAEKFVPNTFSEKEGARLYKTGDLGRWLPDGNIQYLGRIDNQVKIRGFRIELGEIEAVLLQSGLVKQAVVIARESREGVKRLVGYVVSEEKFDKEQLMSKIRLKLPEYMVPSLWVEMEILPLTLNGKIDKKSLPEPDFNEIADKEYVAPRNEFEKKLAEIWQRLLGIERISVHDNFFELGGDSILTIQVVSRARRAGYEFQPKDIFVHQTVAKLSTAIAERSKVIVTAEQGILNDTSGLLPIQEWFLQKEPTGISHFNQSVLLNIDKTISDETLNTAIEYLAHHHDALRFQYGKTKDGWQQKYNEFIPKVNVELIHAGSNGQQPFLIKVICDKYQRSLNIENGTLIQVVLIQTPETEKQNRLFIVIHHLAIDGVSWRILVEDLELLLDSINSGIKINLGDKSSSYRQWYNALEQYSHNDELLTQIKYWRNAVKENYPLKTDTDYKGVVRVKDTSQVNRKLDVIQTRQLIQEVPRIYHTEINDLLLCALAKTIIDHNKTDKITIGLEGHGREEISNEIDISRTVGWFTSLYPLLLEINEIESKKTGDLIKTVKEQLRQVPDKGIGYGVLKYIDKEEGLQDSHPLDIIFNYLGQVDNVVRESKWFSIASESSGESHSPEMEVIEKLSVNSIIIEGELSIDWTYSTKHFEQETVSRLASNYISNLELIITECLQQQDKGEIYTPSDYGLSSEIGYVELDRFLNERLSSGVIRREQIDDLYPLSSLQQGMLFHNLYDGEAAAYTIQLSCFFTKLNMDFFIQSWHAVLKSHTILRSAFYYDKFNIPVQCVYKEVELPVKEIDCREMSTAEQEATIKKHETSERERGFDFKEAPLMRITLIRLDEDRYWMLWTYHHIILDGWSLPILMEEFLSNYKSLALGKSLTSRELDRFENYIHYIERKSVKAQKEYWQNYMKGVETPSLLPFIENSAERNKGAGEYDSAYLEIESGSTTSIKNFAQSLRITPNTLIQGVWAYLLHSYTGLNDVVYGVTASGRPDDLPGVEHGVGLYINPLPLHAKIVKNQKLDEWLKSLQDEQVSSRHFQYTPLSKIQEWSGLEGDLFDCLLTFENYPFDKMIGSTDWGLQVDDVQTYDKNNYPLTIIVGLEEKLHIRFRYNRTLLGQEVMDRIINHFENVLLQFIKNPNQELKDIQITTLSERIKLASYSAKQVSYPLEVSVVELFESQAEATPGATAVVFGETHYTYQELNERSNQLAGYLRSRGVQQDSLVPLYIERSAEMIVGLMGIIKAGGAYVPIDTEFPVERVQYMLEDTDAKVVVSSEAGKEKLGEIEGLEAIAIDAPGIMISGQSTGNLEHKAGPENLAYVIYTSGSTGQPKGVMIEHRSLVDYVYGLKEATGINQCKSFALVSTIATDLGNTVLYSSLLTGGTLHVFTKEAVSDIYGLHRYFAEHAIECLKIVPSHWKALSKEEDLLLPAKLLVFGGEALHRELAEQIQQAGTTCRVVNHYGPTETTIGKLLHEVKKDRKYNKTIPIGKPFSNTQMYVLSKDMELCPIGVPGQLYIAGDGLARGYLNNEALTKSKFIEDPFKKGKLMYSTGDQVKYLEDGNIEFIGRVDNQVKIRGYRIELGEIESILQQSEHVRQGVVVAREDKQGNKKLVAYVVAEDDFDREEIYSYLKEKLPEYMIPSVIMELESLPLTENGKVNRKALPDPETTESHGVGYVLPRNGTEEKLAEIWSEILEVEQVGIHDDFFELGGHSLLAIKLISMIRKELGTEVKIGDVFDYPTIAMLSERLTVEDAAPLLPMIEVKTRPEKIPLSFSQERLWFIDQLEGSLQYHVPAVLRLKGKLNTEALSYALQQLVNRHEVLRTVFREEGGVPYQYIKEKDKSHIEKIGGHQYKEDIEGLRSYIRELVKAPFNLQEDDMLRVHLIELEAEEHVLVTTMHHIASDAWSTSVVVKEVAELYNSYIEKREAKLKEMELQYADYSIWQRGYLKGEILDKKIAYWKEKLQGVTPLELQTDYKRPPVQSTRGAFMNFSIEKQLSGQLKQLSQQEGTTIFITLQAVYKAMLYRYSGQEDISVGTSIARREQQQLEELVGFFVNTLALRDEVKGDMTFKELLQQVRATTMGAYEHQEVPFEKVVEVVVKERDKSRSPLFQVMLVFKNTPEVGALKLGDIELSGDGYEHTTVKFELTFFIEDTENGLEGSVHYCRDLYEEATIERMVLHFTELLKSVVKDPEQSIDLLQMLTEEEEQQLLLQFN